MEATRMITGNYAQTNTASSSNQAGAAGNTSFTQTLVQVLQDDSSAGSSAPLIGTLMPGLLTGPNVPNQEPAQDAAGALLQLLTQLLNGEQKAVSTGTSEAEIEAAEDVDFTSALAQLQLLLLQLLSSQGNDSESSDRAGMNPVTAQGTNIKLGNVANELLQMITSIMQQQAKPSEMKSAVLNLMQTLQPMLVQASTAAVQQNQAQVEQTSTSGTQQTLAFQASGDVYRSMVRKPLKEQTTASTAAAQTLVQIVGDGSRTTGLNALAAKALLQTPVIATVVEASSAELNVNAEQSLEAVTSQSSSEESSNQGLFRLTGTPDQAVKAEAPVIQANRFAHGMSELIKSLNIPNNGGPTAIQITLAPEHLGKVDVRMSMQNGQLVAQFVADSLHGKDLLESQLPQLRAALQAQGLQVERLEVTQSEGSAFAMFQEQRQQQSSQQFNRNQQSGKNGDDTAIDFDAELAVLEARKTALAGSSFDVSA